MNISFFGLGYVGCVGMGCLAQNGHKVIGIDISSEKIKKINEGMPTIVEAGIDEIIREQHLQGRIRATHDYMEAVRESDISFVCVGTPSTNNGHLNLNYIYQTAEDGLADTVKPRLEAADADCEKIMVIDESEKSLSMVDERLEQAIIQTNARLLILDPIQAYLGGGMDMNRANEARDMTKKLGLLAEKHKCAIILIGHMNKAAGNKAAYRGMGSIDFFAVARSVLLVGRIEGQENTRAVVQIKNNLAAFGHSKAFELTEEGFHWLGDYEITADELLGGITPKGTSKTTHL